LALLALSGLLVSGCTAPASRAILNSFTAPFQGVTMIDYEAAQEQRDETVATLTPAQPVEQTFLSRRARLNSLQIWLQPHGDLVPEAVLTLELFASLESSLPILTRSLTHKDLVAQFPITWNFPALDHPAAQQYRLRLTTSDGALQVLGRNEDLYPDGALRLNQRPTASDLSFRLTYEYGAKALLEDFWLGLHSAWLILPLLLTLWLPGRLLLLLVDRDHAMPRFDWGERIALSAGLSLAFWALVLLWSSAVGLRWNPVALWLLTIALLALFAWRSGSIHGLLNWLRRLRQNNENLPASPPARALHLPAFDWISLALMAVFLASFAVRMVMVRDMAAPAWVDAVHHALVTRLILDQGALPQTYQPLLESVSASYHHGYHISLAVFTWLSGLPLHSAMLLFGQVLNALMVFAVYLFTTLSLGNRLAGLFAALLAGLFSPMPAYYASWGRYTQLAGLLLLPVCLALLLAVLAYARNAAQKPSLPVRLLFLGAFSLAGLALVHYRVLAFLLLLLGANLLVYNLQNTLRKDRLANLRRGLLWLVAIGVLSILLSLPWWPAALQNLIVPFASRSVNLIANRPPMFADFSWNYLTPAMGEWVLRLAGLGLLFSMVLRWQFALNASLWVGLMFLIANLAALGLPGGNFINNTSVVIGLFMPLSALGGFALACLASFPGQVLARLRLERLKQSKLLRSLYLSAWVLAALWAGLLGARHLVTLLNPVTMLARQDDLPAIEWIAQNIPAGETILINPFLWGYGIYAGTDGGYWIAPLARRATLPPPVLIGMGGNPQAAQRAIEQSRRASELASNPSELHAYLEEIDIRFLYIGRRGGIFSARLLQESGLFHILYQERGAWVLERVSLE
jgi:hypothetical protein